MKPRCDWIFWFCNFLFWTLHINIVEILRTLEIRLRVWPWGIKDWFWIGSQKTNATISETITTNAASFRELPVSTSLIINVYQIFSIAVEHVIANFILDQSLSNKEWNLMPQKHQEIFPWIACFSTDQYVPSSAQRADKRLCLAFLVNKRNFTCKTFITFLSVARLFWGSINVFSANANENRTETMAAWSFTPV